MRRTAATPAASPSTLSDVTIAVGAVGCLIAVATALGVLIAAVVRSLSDASTDDNVFRDYLFLVCGVTIPFMLCSIGGQLQDTFRTKVLKVCCGRQDPLAAALLGHTGVYD